MKNYAFYSFQVLSDVNCSYHNHPVHTPWGVLSWLVPGTLHMESSQSRNAHTCSALPAVLITSLGLKSLVTSEQSFLRQSFHLCCHSTWTLFLPLTVEHISPNYNMFSFLPPWLNYSLKGAAPLSIFHCSYPNPLHRQSWLTTGMTLLKECITKRRDLWNTVAWGHIEPLVWASRVWLKSSF